MPTGGLLRRDRSRYRHLADNGLMLLGDADRTEYAGYQAFADAGVERIDFFGPRPGRSPVDDQLVLPGLHPWTRGLAALAVSG